MTPFNDQLTAAQAHLDRLKALAVRHPTLFELGNLSQITADYARVYIHASFEPERDWLAWVSQFNGAWVRESSPNSADHWDYDGVVDGIQITLIMAERREPRTPLVLPSKVQVAERLANSLAAERRDAPAAPQEAAP